MIMFYTFLLILILFFSIVCLALRLYFRLTNGICTSDCDLSGRVIVMTGGNTGIGKEYVLDMARRNAQIIMACRNVQSAQECANQVCEQTGNRKIFVEHCDLSSLDSVRKFCERFKAKRLKIDYLVCFAAATGVPIDQLLTLDGMEMHFQCNYLSHFLMIHLLSNLLTDRARIILTSSQAHMYGRIDLKNIVALNNYRKHPFRSYCDSKLALVMLAKELPDRLFRNTCITVNSFHPGTVLTNGIKNNQIWYLRLALKLVAFLYGKSEKDGAQTMIYLTVADEVSGTSGNYYSDCQIASHNSLVDDKQLREKLWNLSYDLIKSCL